MCPRSHKVTDQLRHPARLVHPDEIGVVERVAVDLDDPDVAPCPRESMCTKQAVHRADDKGVDSLAQHCLKAGCLNFDLLFRVAEDEREIPSREFMLDPLNDGGEEWVGDVWDDHAQSPR